MTLETQKTRQGQHQQGKFSCLQEIKLKMIVTKSFQIPAKTQTFRIHIHHYFKRLLKFLTKHFNRFAKKIKPLFMASKGNSLWNALHTYMHQSKYCRSQRYTWPTYQIKDKLILPFFLNLCLQYIVQSTFVQHLRPTARL